MGILLAVIAIFLIRRNREFLVGQVVRPSVRNSVLAKLLDIPEIDAVTFLHLEFVGAERVFLIASVDLVGDPDERDLARQHQAIEDRLEGHPMIERALLTLPTPGAKPLLPDATEPDPRWPA